MSSTPTTVPTDGPTWHAAPDRGAVQRLIVPAVAASTAVVVGVLQLLVMAAWGARQSMGLRDVLMQWDSQWMTLIAEYGYTGFVMTPGQTDPVEWESVAFFPGYPVLVRIVAAPMAVLNAADATYIAALLVSAVASLMLAWGVARLALEMWGRFGPQAPVGIRTSVTVTVAAVVLTFGAPMSIVYWMPYSESLFTALTVWMLVAVLRRQYMLAGLLTLAAGLTRLTAVALILMLCVAAAVELWRWWTRRATAGSAFPVAAVVAPVVGSLGILGYLNWANATVAEVGGYFAAQERGWRSGVDMGAATLRWLSDHLFAGMPGYVMSSWAMVLVALLCLVSLWMLAKGWVPWQVWLVAVLLAGVVLGSDGIMHSRPRLLLIPVLLLMLPLVLRLLAGVLPRRRDASVVGSYLGLAVVAAVWCVLGFWVSGHMLVDFEYAI